jgi:hypothetical protein
MLVWVFNVIFACDAILGSYLASEGVGYVLHKIGTEDCS